MKKESLRPYDILKEQKVSVTKSRLDILEMFCQELKPFSFKEILDYCLSKSSDRSTVFRNLNFFLKRGIIEKIRGNININKDFYYLNLNSGGHLHFIFCQECCQWFKMSSCKVVTMEKDLSSKGFSNLSHKLEFYGICKSCQHL